MWFLADPGYTEFLSSVKQRIQQAQVKAALAVNQELLLLYRQIGKHILEVQTNAERWDKIIPQLAKDLKEAFPTMKGFSRSNIHNMRRFASEYGDHQIVQGPLGQITRYHNIALLEKLDTSEQRIRYAQQAIENGRSRNVMVMHIERKLFEARWKAITNFTTTLTKPNSDLASSLLKDPYNFDFLMLSDRAKEKDIEDALVNKITHFLLELGSGFAYMGRQFNLKVGQEDFYLDLLFYHIKLRCYVVIELKTTKFKPEYAGKLGFYQTAIDREVKSESDNPTIGILLCKSKDEITAQYTLDSLKQPIGVSEYLLDHGLPENLQSELPSVEDLEDTLKQIEIADE